MSSDTEEKRRSEPGFANVLLVGRLREDAAVVERNGKTKTTMNLVCNKRFRDGRTEAVEVFCEDWQHKPGLLPYLRKGRQLGIDGQLKSFRKTNEHGEYAYTALWVGVESLILLDPGKNAGGDETMLDQNEELEAAKRYVAQLQFERDRAQEQRDEMQRELLELQGGQQALLEQSERLKVALKKAEGRAKAAGTTPMNGVRGSRPQTGSTPNGAKAGKGGRK